jgi:hypothetical protein
MIGKLLILSRGSRRFLGKLCKITIQEQEILR